MATDGMRLRDAGPDDAGLILAYVRELAEYERLLHEVAITEADVRRDLFGPAPRVFCTLAEIAGGDPAGFSLWFYSYSTFAGRHGIYLEDLFVRPAITGPGAGTGRNIDIAAPSPRQGLAPREMSVLDWNAPSIAFYRGLGAIALDDWTKMRVSGPALAALAASQSLA